MTGLKVWAYPCSLTKRIVTSFFSLVGGWPEAQNIDRISRIEISHGDVVDGIRVYYQLKTEEIVTKTHGGDWRLVGTDLARPSQVLLYCTATIHSPCIQLPRSSAKCVDVMATPCKAGASKFRKLNLSSRTRRAAVHELWVSFLPLLVSLCLPDPV